MAYVGKFPLTGAYQILDDISSGFNGSTATFNLTTSGTAVSPETEASVIISVSGFLVLFLVILLTSENQLMQQ
jgi:hypothetical protein